MKKNIIKILATGVIGTTLLATTVLGASTAGSSDDPIVTKSYVDTQVSQIMSIISSNAGSTSGSGSTSSSLSDADKKKLVEEITQQVVAIINATSSTGTDSTISLGTSYEPVELKKGQILLGGEGTEIILRSGVANAFVSTTNGIVNATVGSELMNGQAINKNNIIIVPRADGRGVIANSDGTWLLVKGTYTIQ